MKVANILPRLSLPQGNLPKKGSTTSDICRIRACGSVRDERWRIGLKRTMHMLSTVYEVPSRWAKASRDPGPTSSIVTSGLHDDVQVWWNISFQRLLVRRNELQSLEPCICPTI